LFEGGFSVPRTVPLLGIRGDLYDGVPQSEFGGDPDQLLRPVSGTLARIPWYDTPVAQVLTAYAEAGGGLEWIDPRHPLLSVLERYKADRRSVTVATELEFYLLADGNGPRPEPLVGRMCPGPTCARKVSSTACPTISTTATHSSTRCASPATCRACP
jgi:glutamine synthetase